MRTLLAVVAAAEAVVGLILLVYPPIVIRLLFGAEVSGAGVVMSRVAGMSLLGLGLACWPAPDGRSRAMLGLLTYTVLVTLYLAHLGINRHLAGVLLWPAVVVHAATAVLLARAWVSGSRGRWTR